MKPSDLPATSESLVSYPIFDAEASEARSRIVRYLEDCGVRLTPRPVIEDERKDGAYLTSSVKGEPGSEHALKGDRHVVEFMRHDVKEGVVTSMLLAEIHVSPCKSEIRLNAAAKDFEGLVQVIKPDDGAGQSRLNRLQEEELQSRVNELEGLRTAVHGRHVDPQLVLNGRHASSGGSDSQGGATPREFQLSRLGDLASGGSKPQQSDSGRPFETPAHNAGNGTSQSGLGARVQERFFGAPRSPEAQREHAEGVLARLNRLIGRHVPVYDHSSLNERPHTSQTPETPDGQSVPFSLEALIELKALRRQKLPKDQKIIDRIAKSTLPQLEAEFATLSEAFAAHVRGGVVTDEMIRDAAALGAFAMYLQERILDQRDGGKHLERIRRGLPRDESQQR